MPEKFALLDRDGTIIVDKEYLSDPEGVEFTVGAIDGLKLLRDSGFGLILVTNQSGIGRGYFDASALEQVHARLKALLAQQDIEFEAIYFCPHSPGDRCNCRKPAPGMIIEAMRDFGFSPHQAVFIGDSDADMGAAAASGVQGILIDTKHNRNSEMSASNFLEAAMKACALLSGQ